MCEEKRERNNYVVVGRTKRFWVVRDVFNHTKKTRACGQTRRGKKSVLVMARFFFPFRAFFFFQL